MSQTDTVEINLPPKIVDLFEGEARYRCAYGGRGSAKTRSFALMTAVRGYQWGMEGKQGQILCAREHLNSLDESSLEEVKSAIRGVKFLSDYYELGEKYIRSKDGRINYVFSGLRRNLDSIKSKARIILCWVDEAEGVSDSAWQKLIPTVREDDSEIWVTWNPETKHSATHRRFRVHPPQDMKIAEINWRDNPFFPKVLVRLIDYYESSGVGLDHYARVLGEKGYVYDQHILPHDVRVRELGTGRSRLETLDGLGVRPVHIAPQLNVDDGIQAVRSMLPRCWFDKDKCERGVDALRQYRREYDEKGMTWRSRPLHDWTSHCADAMRYLAIGYKETTNWGEPIRRNLQGIV